MVLRESFLPLELLAFVLLNDWFNEISQNISSPSLGEPMTPVLIYKQIRKKIHRCVLKVNFIK